MKKYLLGIVTMFMLASCNDDYLEKKSKTSLSEDNAFITAENFKTFSWGFYPALTSGYRNIDVSLGTYGNDFACGYLDSKTVSTAAEANGRRTQTVAAGTTGNGWSFSTNRRCNLMLQNIDKSEMSQADKDHYRALGLFFRSFDYFELIARFGDVPWIDKVLAENDTDIIYGSRTPRKEVADHVMEDLQWAETHIRAAGDGPNTVNTNVVRSLMSRFFLFEGTFRKYHGLGDSDKYLDECIRVSNLLAAAYPTVSNNFDALYNTLDLKGFPGVIMYKEYIKSVLTQDNMRYERANGLNPATVEMPRCTVENYLCSDGKPISTSTVYQGNTGNKSMFREFRNRDYRLLSIVVPPYSLKQSLKGGSTNPDYTPAVPAAYSTAGYYVDTDVADPMEFNTVLAKAFPGTTKRLPAFIWNAGNIFNSPNITNVGVPQLASLSGYTLWKWYNTFDDVSSNPSQGETDRPIFWIEEVLLNLAEASYERGQFTQAIADKTINRLRPRAGVANMIVSNIDASFDPARNPEVPPVLWEIRRERQSELMGGGFGWNDVRRWKQGPWYLNKPYLGVFVTRTNYKNLDANGNPTATNTAAWQNATNLPLVNRDFTPATTAGYVKRFDDPTKIGKGWLDKYYLEWIPTTQIALNPQIKQNPGW